MLNALEEERDPLVRIWLASGLSAWEFAAAIGVDPTTVERHLRHRGSRSRARQEWYRRVIRVERRRNEVHIIVARPAPTRKNVAFWWRRGLTRDPDAPR